MHECIAITLIIIFAGLAFYAQRNKWLHGLGFTFSVFAFGIAAMAYPKIFISWGGFELKNLIVPLVQFILFGMGMTLTIDDFKRVLKMPRAIFIGFVLQYTIMPLSGFIFAAIFGLKSEIAAGLILIGSCPGGVSSNVINFLARANVPLSVAMTVCSTLLSPVMTPLGMKLLAGRYVPIEFWPMMWSIMEIVILPLMAGVIINKYFPRAASKMTKVLPFLAMFSICIIIAITIALSRNDLVEIGIALFLASVCHNTTGYLLGYYGSRLLGLNKIDSRTVAIEVGIQNGGMATGLAFNVLKSAQAALASAVFGPWSAVSSSMLATYWRRKVIAEEKQSQILSDEKSSAKI